MNMRQLRRAHRAACWVPPVRDEHGNVVFVGRHRVPLRTWVRIHPELHEKLTGKALSILHL